MATLLTCAAYTLAYPPFDGNALAWVALAPVAAVLMDPRVRFGLPTALLAGFAFGYVTSLAIVGYWSFIAARDFFARSTPFSVAFTLAVPLLSSGIALWYAGAFACIRLLATTGIATRIAGFACIWTAFEWMRATIGYGNPWGILGDALAPFRLVRQVADLGGVWMLTWLAAAFAACAATAWVERRAWPLLLCAAIVAGPCVYGWWRLETLARETSAHVPLRIGLVQPALGGRALWEPASADAHVEHLAGLSRSGELWDVDLIVWPENALPFLLDANAEREQALRALAVSLDAAIIAGGSRSATVAAGSARIFNSAFFFPMDGSAPLVSDKMRLMPYTETRPHWASWLGGSTWQGAYSQGDQPTLFPLLDQRIGSLMCFEAADPRLARRLVRDGATVLVNLSNDSWFDAGAGPEQHFVATRLRAVETHRPLVRVATTGVSAVIDATGDIMARLPTRQSAAALVEDVRPATVVTPYVRWGDWIVWLSMVAGAGILAVRLATGGRERY
ncbi:MAG TPA: apolipoprotein N-acyltransferase [Candidatus Limnocylindrales bacterium]|nr:apolipoprotein N-acyltransferase [Candidatus Limnocylindrales bacterium]